MDTSDNNNWGGKRTGAGRQFGTGKFKEPTEVVRVPRSQKPVILDFLKAYQRKKSDCSPTADILAFELPNPNPVSIKLPLYGSKVRAGFPSPADDHVEKRLDVAEFLIDQQDATFFATIAGDSMRDAGLLPGDKVVIDRSKRPKVGDIVLAVIDGEFTIKTLGKSKDNSPRLIPANPDYPIILIKEGMQFEIFGVVTGSFRRFR